MHAYTCYCSLSKKLTWFLHTKYTQIKKNPDLHVGLTHSKAMHGAFINTATISGGYHLIWPGIPAINKTEGGVLLLITWTRGSKSSLSSGHSESVVFVNPPEVPLSLITDRLRQTFDLIAVSIKWLYGNYRCTFDPDFIFKSLYAVLQCIYVYLNDVHRWLNGHAGVHERVFFICINLEWSMLLVQNLMVNSW